VVGAGKMRGRSPVEAGRALGQPDHRAHGVSGLGARSAGCENGENGAMAMGRAIVVLGGGGVKGIAHVGAWKAIEESDLEGVGIIGTRIAALVGACIAAGWGSRELEPRAASLKKVDIVSLKRWTLLMNGIRQPSVFRGEQL